MALVAIVAMLGTGVAPAAAKAPDESERTTITTFGFVPTDSAGTAAQTDVEAQIAEVESLEASDTPLAAPYDSSKMPSGSAKDRAAMAAGDTAPDAIEWECWIGSCKPKRSMTVKVVIENARMSDGKQKGLITAYCMGVTVCPQWVINVAG